MPIGHKDHRAIPVGLSVGLGGSEQPFDLGLRQVLAGAKVGIWQTLRCNCSVYGARCPQPEMRFRHVLCRLRMIDCSYNGPNTNTFQVRSAFDGSLLRSTYGSAMPGHPDFKMRGLKGAAAAEITRAACSPQGTR